MTKTFSLDQVASHNSPSSCWVIISNNVYDVTEFLPSHPGGTKIILKYGGKDATSAYEPIHPPDALEKNLPPEKHLGQLDSAAASAVEQAAANKKKTVDELRVEAARKKLLPLSRMLSVLDMEKAAHQVLSHKAWAYYSSAADEELTNKENARAFSRYYFHPRVMRPVAHCDPSTTILGFKSTIPVFVSGAALARLGHPLGEANITRGAGQSGIVQMPLFFQLYKHRDDKIAEQRVRDVVALGYNAIFLTVDAIVAGNRERDIRAPYELEEQEAEAERAANPDKATGEADMPQTKVEGPDPNLMGTAGALVANDDIDMTWERTIPWLRSVTTLPIVIKGVQCVEDCVAAAEAGCDGVLISNHGGRQLEYSLPGIEVLYRLRKQRPDVFDKLEDVLKALCLGAKAVGMGRAFLYAQSGVIKTIVRGMQLLGASNVKQLVPEMVERVDWQPLTPKL
ncbi:uncharacterized protein BXZ73DRAFT_87388 [Epithele typhae]|uniref:uncharacterized protein n=1 Tax=Epithele typhae TaxID=378194 RepID=UPI002007C376|nr:uncharacterized protein BXZ73DRAFT_87388 [Epithele typhae]KAH9944503.1 hypothetical protein BXZ73DRAFT_87388 [Epithele typhae]